MFANLLVGIIQILNKTLSLKINLYVLFQESKNLNYNETKPHILATTRVRGSVIVFICRLIHLKQFLQLAT